MKRALLSSLQNLGGTWPPIPTSMGNKLHLEVLIPEGRGGGVGVSKTVILSCTIEMKPGIFLVVVSKRCCQTKVILPNQLLSSNSASY